MYTLLLILIYITFISLGIPDSLFGAAWPAIHLEIGVPAAYGGMVTILMSGGTIIASLLSGRLTHRFGACIVTASGVVLSSLALFCFSISSAFWMLPLFALPLGLGAGSIDAAINNYVSLHYNSRHMNWLHCFWGVGASIGPYIMGYSLSSGLGWNSGYLSVSAIQIILAIIIFISYPLWKREGKSKPVQDNNKKQESSEPNEAKQLSLAQLIKIKGVKYVLIAFFAYCGVEATSYMWASTYLVQYRGIATDVAARYASLFFIGITVGRFLSGVISDKIGGRNMIRLGFALISLGIIAVVLPVPTDMLCLYGLVTIGLGCAPIFPALIHATPANFGKENSASLIGVQMACAYTGSSLMPPLFGLLAGWLGFGLYPMYISIFLVLMVVLIERLNRILKNPPDFIK